MSKLDEIIYIENLDALVEDWIAHTKAYTKEELINKYASDMTKEQRKLFIESLNKIN